MEIFALFMLCGFFTTFLIPETKRKTLEDLAGEVPGTSSYTGTGPNVKHASVDETSPMGSHDGTAMGIKA